MGSRTGKWCPPAPRMNGTLNCGRGGNDLQRFAEQLFIVSDSPALFADMRGLIDQLHVVTNIGFQAFLELTQRLGHEGGRLT